MIRKAIKLQIVTNKQSWPFYSSRYSKIVLNTAKNGSFEPLFSKRASDNLNHKFSVLNHLTNSALVAQLDRVVDFEGIQRSPIKSRKSRVLRPTLGNLQQLFTANLNCYSIFEQFWKFYFAYLQTNFFHSIQPTNPFLRGKDAGYFLP